MESPSEVGWKMNRHAFTVLLLSGLLLTNDSGYCTSNLEKAAIAANDPYMTVTVRSASLVFIGSVNRLLKPPCGSGGLAIAHQGIVFEVKRVLKGDSKMRGGFTVYTPIDGSPLEVSIDGCSRLSPRIFEAGRMFMVACEQSPTIAPKGLWTTVGGPWLADQDAEKTVVSAIAEGDIDFPQYVWLREEIDIERFIQGEDVAADPVLRAIRFFDKLTGSQSSQSNRGIEEISKSDLQDDLNGWRAWYEKHHRCLAWDKRKSDEVVDKACMAKENQ